MLGALLCGAGIAGQTRINGELSAALDDGYVAAVISFASGLILVLLVLVFSSSGRRGLGVIARGTRTRQIPLWQILGGASGALFVLSQGLSAAVLGIAVFTVAVVFGQTVSGLIIDRRGMGSMPPRTITPARIGGSALMLASVALVVSTQFTDSVPLWLVLVPLVAGFVVPFQLAANGELRVASGSPISATFVNFVVGIALLLIVTAVRVAFVGLPATFPTNPALYLGGVLGAGFIGLGAALAPRIGVLLLALGTISGQLIAALLLDLVAPADGHPLAATTIIGTVVTVIALIVAAAPNPGTTASKDPKEPTSVRAPRGSFRR